MGIGSEKASPELYALWDEFLAAWPISRLSSMTLADYSETGKLGTFTHWLEIRLEDLGSIWGGSAFKFGIYHRNNREKRESGAGRSYSDEYAWYSKYGDSSEEAFEAVKREVKVIAECARDGQFSLVENSMLGPAVKWKIAFLYQERNRPRIIPVYDREHLRVFLKNPPQSVQQYALYDAINKLRGNSELFEFGRKVWQDSEAILADKNDTVIRDEAVDAKPYQNSRSAQMQVEQPLNQILYGPPGTGKTYTAVEKAVEIVDPGYASSHTGDRKAIRRRYDELLEAGRIGFVTFHQSFSYEDFVEGIRAELNEKQQLNYPVVDGIFKKICDAASAKITKHSDAPISLENRRIWKMSLGNTLTDGDGIYQECLEDGRVLLGYGDDIDFTGAKSRQDIRKQFEKYDAELSGKDSYAVTAVSTFILEMRKGDLVVVSDGNHKFRGIAEITGDYKFLADERRDGYWQSRSVRWLRAYSPSLPRDQLMNNAFSQMTLYELRPGSINLEKLAALLNAGGSLASLAGSNGRNIKLGDRLGGDYEVMGVTDDVLRLRKPNGAKLPFDWEMLDELASYVREGKITVEDIRQRKVFEKVDSKLEKFILHGYENVLASIVEKMLTQSIASRETHSWVLVIDEINRGNVSRIFGELITLLEPDKRAGGAEALSVTLPYSKDDFSVPSNLHIIGTMNTADRSLTGLDIALRRRFEFEEVAPNPGLLSDIVVEGVKVGDLLESMNARIEVLLNSDHCLGHSYFMSLQKSQTIESLAEIFRRQILPLLEEYFFEDWERIRWVLNDHRKPDAAHRFYIEPSHDIKTLLGEGEQFSTGSRRWRLNKHALMKIDSYRQIIKV